VFTTLGSLLHKCDHEPNYDGCKIVLLVNRAAAGISGSLDYVRNDSSDGIPDWDPLLDARASYEKDGNDMQAMAADWGERANRHHEFVSRLAGTPLGL